MLDHAPAIPYTEMLLDPNACTWNDVDVPLEQRGVRLSWLAEFISALIYHVNQPTWQAATEYNEAYRDAKNQQRAADYGPWDIPDPVWPTPPHEPVEYTTRQFVQEHIVPLTASLKAPLYALAPPDARGEPQIFISHAWDAYIARPGGWRLGTFDAIHPSGIAGVKEEFVWMDIACYNQHTFETIATDMKAVIQSIGKVAFAMTPKALFDRMWCIWELFCAAQLPGSQFSFCAAPGYRTEKRMIVNDNFSSFKSISQAKAFIQDDHTVLSGAMIEFFGSVEAADAQIKEIMRTHMSNPWYELYP